MKNREVCVIADGAAIGPEMNGLYEISHKKKNIHLYLPESFEWIVLKSGLIDDREIRKILETPELFIDSKKYFSWERFFTNLLIEKTKNSYLQYRKSAINKTYLHSKIKKNTELYRSYSVVKAIRFGGFIMWNEIKDFAAPELDVYARTSEVQLLRYYEPEPGIFIAESPKVIERALNAGYQPISFLVEHKDLEGGAQEILKQYPDVPVYTAEYELLVKLTGFALTRGMLCAMRRNPLPSVEEICRNASRIAVLENVVNPTNIGAIFRSAAALHMDAVLLTGGCSDPLYRRAARVSMGTVFQIPWTYFDKKTVWPQDGMQTLQNLGFKTAAMALRDDSVGIDDKALRSEEKLAVILGTEGDGLASQTIADCDYTVKIPMSHGVDSLNVAAASAVAFWELGHRE